MIAPPQPPTPEGSPAAASPGGPGQVPQASVAGAGEENGPQDASPPESVADPQQVRSSREAGDDVGDINLVDRPELNLPGAFDERVTEVEAGSRTGTGQRTNDGGDGNGGGVGGDKSARGASGPSEDGRKSDPIEKPVDVQERPYNPDEARDTTRQTITLWLIGLLCAIVVLAFVALFASGAATGFTGKEFLEGLKTLLSVLVGPVITLLASAVGFYFGSKQGEATAAAKNNNRTP